MESKLRLLRHIYYDPKHPGSYGSSQRLQNTTRKETEYFLQSQEAHTRNRQFRFKFKRRNIMVPRVDYLWQADLITVKNISRKNKGNQYLLTVIDVLSRFAFVEPIKRKTGRYVVEALMKILSSSGRKPKYLQTDQGLEFLNSNVNDLLNKQDITHFHNHSPLKAAMVERFNRTLMNKLYKFFLHTEDYKYLHHLQDFVYRIIILCIPQSKLLLLMSTNTINWTFDLSHIKT
jgi:hypothetical protein